MRALVKTVKSTLIVTSVLLATSASLAAEASGDGRSGDDQAGVSIPVNMDRGITVAQMNKALHNCEKIVPIAFLSQLLRQNVSGDSFQNCLLLTNPNPKGNKVICFIEDQEFFSANSTFVGGYSVDVSDSIPFQKRNGDISDIPSYEISDDVYSMLENSIPKEYRANNQYRQSTINLKFTGGIRIEYAVQKDSGYTEIGDLVSENQIVTSINVAGETFLSRIHSNGGVPDQSKDKLMPTRLRTGKDKVIECIQNSLAK